MPHIKSGLAKPDRSSVDIEIARLLWRAISKFIATFDDASPQMTSWAKAAGAELLAEKKQEAAS